MISFILFALLAGIGIALVAGPVGCMMTWRKKTYFGATLSHAALLGIALSLVSGMNPQLSVLLVSLAVSVLLMLLQRRQLLDTDTLLAILAHASLALGLVCMSFIEQSSASLTSYLLGDILAVTQQDLIWIGAGGLLIAVLLKFIWGDLLSLTLNRDLALVDGANETVLRFLFLVILSVLVSISMQVIGLLLIISLLIIPAATARFFSNSPEKMALLASCIGVLSVVLGFAGSYWLDLPTGPAIVCVSFALFLAARLKPASSVAQ